MVYLLNGGLSGGNPNKRALENGYHCSSLGDTPKFKPRKVSAVRVFPQGCGRDAPQIIPEPLLNVSVAFGEQDEVRSFKVMESPVRVDTNGNMVVPHLKSVGEAIEGNRGIEVVTQLCAARETNEFRMPADLEHQEIVDAPVGNDIVMVEKADVTQTSAEPEIQSDPVLGNAFGMQVDILSNDLVGKVVDVVIDGMDNQVEKNVLHVKPLDIELPKDLERKSFEISKERNGTDAQALVKRLDNVDSLALVNHEPEENLKPSSDLKDEAVTSPKDKFRRRRVSATRDFPPFCGRNVHTLAEEEHLRITSGEKSLTGIEKGGEPVVAGGGETKENIEDGGSEGRGGRVSLPNRESSAVRVKVYEEGDVSARKDIVIHEPVGAVKRRPSNDVFTSEHNEEPLVVNALTAAPYCPWGLRNVASSSDVVKTGASANKHTAAVRDNSLTGIENGGEVVVADGRETKVNIDDGDFEGSGGIVVSLPNRISSAVGVKEYMEGEVSERKEIVICEPVGVVKRRASTDVFTSELDEEPVLVNALLAAQHCPWRQEKVAKSPDAVKTGGRASKCKVAWLKKRKAVAKKTTINADSSERTSLKMDTVSVCQHARKTPGLPAVKDEEEYGEHSGPPQDLRSGCTHDIELALPPYGPNSSRGDARNKVRETLRLFQTICKKLLQGEEAKKRPEAKRIDLDAVKIMKDKGIDVAGKEYMGAVPGVEVGDEFHYRVELVMIGIHRLYQAGIDYIKEKGMPVAISIVSSGAYADDKEDADSLIYSGQGGNIAGKDKEPEDQKLERGNLALRNSITTKNPVRVIHGSKEAKMSNVGGSKSKIVTTYVYDGLYTVENYWQEEGTHGKLVYMFKLKRIPGQPELAWKEVKKSNKSKVRHGICVTDIAEGKELIPICAVNTVGHEKPPAFSYITKVMYADLSHLLPQGCDCTGRCSDSVRCPCARKNGGQIPYNRNGAIVEAKPLVYECGPSCRCPPSCYNRVSQHGVKLPLEIFKTDTRGWGVRSLTSIPSGTFICEYVGELLEEKEAEKRTNDEYLFDIGQNYSDCSVNRTRQAGSTEFIEEVGYTIDAAYYGNVGRFINHSCSPNLYAQNVLYDHDDKRMPHIMLFAAENIPTLKELTYHYNYSLDQVRDSNGNIKMKSCYCGSSDCTGRLY